MKVILKQDGTSETQEVVAKGGSARSKMLRMIMPMLSRENGDKLAQAIEDRDGTRFGKVWNSIRQEVIKSLSSSDDSFEMSSGTAHDNYDYSRVLMGNGSNTVLNRSLIANGVATFMNSKNVEYTIRITSIKVHRGDSGEHNVDMEVIAILSAENVSPSTIRETLELGPAISEIVLKAVARAR